MATFDADERARLLACRWAFEARPKTVDGEAQEIAAALRIAYEAGAAADREACANLCTEAAVDAAVNAREARLAGNDDAITLWLRETKAALWLCDAIRARGGEGG